MTIENAGSMCSGVCVKRRNVGQCFLVRDPIRVAAYWSRGCHSHLYTSFVDLDDQVAIRINVTAIHAVCVERQSDVTVLVDCDQTAGAAELFHGVESRLCRFLQL